jgi:fluoride exporter
MPPHPPHRWEHHDERLPVDPDLAPDDPGEPAPDHHPIPHVHRARQHDVLAAIGGGGFLGALGRYELELAWPTADGHIPWATFAVNTSGAFLLGLILTVLLERVRPTRYLRPFLCVGVLGAWTTMSTFAVETDLLAKDGQVVAAIAYVVATVALGLAAAWLGSVAARYFDPRRASWASR